MPERHQLRRAGIPAFQGTVAALALASLLGCGDRGPEYGTPARISLVAEAATARFGALEDSTGLRVLSSVRHASLSASGRFLAVGDNSPPFLRIFDRVTGEAIMFGRRGGGPGELVTAGSLEFLGDTLLMVHSRQSRIESFNLSGEWRGGIGLERAGFSLIRSFTRGCGGRSFIVGLEPTYRTRDTVSIIHEVLPNGPVVSVPHAWVPRPMAITPYVRGFDGTPEGLLVWMDWLSWEAGFWIPCDGGEAELWAEFSHDGLPEPVSVRLGEGRGGSVLTLPDSTVAGAVAYGQRKYRIVWPWAREGQGDATKLRVFDGGMCREVELDAEWDLHEATATELVLSRRDPFPEVWVVDLQWLEGQMTPVACSGL